MKKQSKRVNKFIKKILSIVSICLLLLNTNILYSQEKQDLESHEPKARAVLEEILSKGSNIINEINSTKNSKLEKLSELVGFYSNSDEIKNLLLGPYLNRMTDVQKDAYNAIIKDYLARSLSIKLLFLKNADYKILSYRIVSNDFHYDVLITSNDVKTPVTVVVSNASSLEPKITDVIISGASLLVAQRSEFASILRRGGADGLIELLTNFMTKSQ